MDDSCRHPGKHPDSGLNPKNIFDVSEKVFFSWLTVSFYFLPPLHEEDITIHLAYLSS